MSDIDGPPYVPTHFRVWDAILTPPEAVNLASKLLQFATQEGTK